MPIGGFAIADDDTRARIRRGARVSTRFTGRRRDAETRRGMSNCWIW
jgi:hypothetical protein